MQYEYIQERKTMTNWTVSGAIFDQNAFQSNPSSSSSSRVNTRIRIARASRNESSVWGRRASSTGVPGSTFAPPSQFRARLARMFRKPWRWPFGCDSDRSYASVGRANSLAGAPRAGSLAGGASTSQPQSPAGGDDSSVDGSSPAHHSRIRYIAETRFAGITRFAEIRVAARHARIRAVARARSRAACAVVRALRALLRGSANSCQSEVKSEVHARVGRSHGRYWACTRAPHRRDRGCRAQRLTLSTLHWPAGADLPRRNVGPPRLVAWRRCGELRRGRGDPRR
mmetsp:Transcript_13596/g.42017  ORF Transcript_13596/g.42017 Transcript_13596/m.42017 type:complete len:284 (-) Transcript_13596:81-932(-)